jgi:hypothetical protein
MSGVLNVKRPFYLTTQEDVNISFIFFTIVVATP